MLAMIVARRPTTSPSASIRCHFFSTSCGLADLVVFISAFMALFLQMKCERRHQGHRRERANRDRPAKSQAIPAICRRVKKYLRRSRDEAETTGTARALAGCSGNDQKLEASMYI